MRSSPQRTEAFKGTGFERQLRKLDLEPGQAVTFARQMLVDRNRVAPFGLSAILLDA